MSGRVGGAAATVAGLAVIFALSYLDAAWDSQNIMATIVMAPFVTAMRASARQTAAVALFAVVAGVLSGGYNANYGTSDYFVRLVVVIAGAAFAVAAAHSRRRLAADQARFELLRGAAQIADRRDAAVPEVVDRVGELLVPAFADVCVIDVLRGGKVERLGVVASGPRREQIERGLRARSPGTEAEVLPAVPLLAERVDESHLRANARDAADIEFLRSLGERSHIRVPLRSRGRAIGILSLLATTRSYRPEDLQFAQLLGGRVGLALDNAGLFAELESLQARLTTALDTLAEAVTIQDERGRLVYANDAAAQTFGFESAEAFLATPPQEIADRFASFHEDGTPLALEDLPGRAVLRDEHPPPLLVRAVDRRTGEERWRMVKATAVPSRAGGPRLAVNVIDDVTDVKRAELAQRFLAEATAVLASSLDYEQTLAKVAELAVPRLADWCSVSLPRGDRLRAVALAHSDPEKVALARGYQERYPSRAAEQVLRENAPRLVNDIDEEAIAAAIDDPERREQIRSLGLRSVMLVPMISGPRAIGVITLVSAESGRRFGEADLESAQELGRRAGTAVENARLYEERSHIAATLQRSLLPDELPQIPGLELASLYRPAGEQNLVGGDFYDAFETPTGWMLLVGDVTGRGAEAAALTGQARHTLRTAGMLLGDPDAALRQLNQALAQRAELTPCTVALVHVAPDARSAAVRCAGHPQPLLVRDGEARPVGHFGPMLGAWRDSAWRAEEVALRAGDALVLYTDGVTDTVGHDGRFGDERLLRSLHGVSGASAAVAAIDRALTAFQRGPQADDTAVLALSVT